MTEHSPGPGHARTRRMDTLTPARRVVLDVLGTADGAATIAEVAQATGLHLNTVREHLEALVDSGLANRGRLAPQGRGRPASTYEYAAQADVLSPGYGLMTSVTIGYLAHAFGDGPESQRHAYRAGRMWGREIIERGLLGGVPAEAGEDGPATSLGSVSSVSSADSAGSAGSAGSAVASDASPDADGEVAQPLRAALDLLADAGFEPTLVDEPRPSRPTPTSGPEVRLPRCPVLTLAREHPRLVCEAHLGMVDEVLGSGSASRRPVSGSARDATRMEAFVNPGYCSLFFGVDPEAAGLVVGAEGDPTGR